MKVGVYRDRTAARPPLIDSYLAYACTGGDGLNSRRGEARFQHDVGRGLEDGNSGFLAARASRTWANGAFFDHAVILVYVRSVQYCATMDEIT